MTKQMDMLLHECYEAKIEKLFPEKLALLEEFKRIKIFDKGYSL